MTPALAPSPRNGANRRPRNIVGEGCNPHRPSTAHLLETARRLRQFTGQGVVRSGQDCRFDQIHYPYVQVLHFAAPVMRSL